MMKWTLAGLLVSSGLLFIDHRIGGFGIFLTVLVAFVALLFRDTKNTVRRQL